MGNFVEATVSDVVNRREDDALEPNGPRQYDIPQLVVHEHSVNGGVEKTKVIVLLCLDTRGTGNG